MQIKWYPVWRVFTLILPEAIDLLAVAQSNLNAVIKKGPPNYKSINDDSLIACFFQCHCTLYLYHVQLVVPYKVQFPAVQPKFNLSTKNKHILQLGKKEL